MKYKFNGIVLPALPEYDHDAYPYAVIGNNLANESWEDGGSNRFYACSSRPYLNADGEVILGTAEAPCLYTTCEDGNEWGTLLTSSAADITNKYPIWTNTDILNEAGEVVLEASEPISTFCLRSWLTGLVLSLSGKPLPLNTGKKIVAYSYNGTVLPKLPEWDREMYPYAMIAFTDLTYADDVYRLVVGAEPPVKPVDDPNHIRIHAKGMFVISVNGTEWSDGNFNWDEGWNAVDRNVVWVNADVYNMADGTLVMAASEPVPVYE